MVLYKISAGAFFLASVFFCASAMAQSTGSDNARTHSASATPAAESHSDIFSPSYVPPKPKHRVGPTPTLAYSVEPQFPADGPKGKFSGTTVIAMLVGTDGKPEQVHVVKSLGPEFDKAAVAAVEQYRFRPALQHGKPAPVKVDVEVSFRRY